MAVVVVGATTVVAVLVVVMVVAATVKDMPCWLTKDKVALTLLTKETSQ